MIQRLINASASDFQSMTPADLLASIRKSEGRTIVSEVITQASPLLKSVTNAELAAAFGADIILLNMFDVENPHIEALPECNPEECVQKLKKLTGRPIGINLEPAVNPNEGNFYAWSKGRLATAENAELAVKLGVDLILLTGNPGKHVTNEGITSALKSIRDVVGDGVILAAGKMHASGTLEGGSDILSIEDINDFAAAGADIILLPAPGTVPGITLSWASERVNAIHSLHCLAMTSIGTSQEGADLQTIRSIALMCKQCGTDIHHIGDTGGTLGIAEPDNIMAYSIAIRGRQHTWFRMAQSINR